MTHYLYQTSLDHGSTALSHTGQLQQMMLVNDQAEWAFAPCRLVFDILWPQLCEPWHLKEAWAGW